MTFPAAQDLYVGDPTWLSAGDMSNYHTRIVKNVTSKGASWPAGDIPAVLIVSARETIIGCHSFEQFLAPDLVTFFVFDRWTADPIYGLSQWVSSLTSTQTKASFLFVTDEHYGEILARKIAYDIIIARGLDAKVKTLFNVNCDIHPIQTNHSRYRSMPDLGKELYWAMANESLLRSRSRTGVFNNNTGREHYEVFAIGPVTLETLPTSGTDFEGAVVHGNDVDGYASKYHHVKPASLGKTPWIIDSLAWCEGHIIMINFTLLQRISSVYFSMDQYLTEQRVYQSLLPKHLMTVLRHNDFAAQFQLARVASDLSTPAYAVSVLDMDEMKLRNYEILALCRSPWRINTTFFDLISRVGVTLDRVFAMGFGAERIKNHWIPSYLTSSATKPNKTLNDYEGRRFFKAQMMIAGYYEDPSFLNTTFIRYVMKKVYPSVYLITQGVGYKFFGTIQQGPISTNYFTNDWNTKTYGSTQICGTLSCLNKIPLSARILDIPRSATIANSFLPYIVNEVGPVNASYSVSLTGGILPQVYFAQAISSP
eukprot:TRINITY_DN2058_c0_g1_i1.p1 TRINITY_DN2058_c0_g1~~TRINITY_DN2058_c0_g1_i1.p1  ORF type:complete len:568 (+),score=110.25 TRINITY_DN2058_c0_g1_i1:92-1705(+)